MARHKKDRSLTVLKREAQQAKAKHEAQQQAQKKAEQARLKKHKQVSERAAKQRSVFPYTTRDVILLVGEGNFSFAHSIAQTLGTGIHITATAYDSEETTGQKYPDAATHVAGLKSLGATVLFDIDATMLGGSKPSKSAAPLVGHQKFTHVVFNFPHVGAGIKDQGRNIRVNQEMMAGFFHSVKGLLSASRDCPGQLARAPAKHYDLSDSDSGSDDEQDASSDDESHRHVRKRRKHTTENTGCSDEGSTDKGGAFEFEGHQTTVTYTMDSEEEDEGSNANSEKQEEDGGNSGKRSSAVAPDLNRLGQIHVSLKSGLPYSQWNVRHLARECGFACQTSWPFDTRMYPGYQHRRTLGFKPGVSKDENEEIRSKDPKTHVFVVRQNDSGPDAGEDVGGSGNARRPPQQRGGGKKTAGPRLTIDEKRKRMMEIFHESQEPYLLKELEKIGPKQKGIVSQTVKDVVQSLVDDSMCYCEKIGTSNYFWSFPSETAVKRQNKTKELEAEIGQLETKGRDLETSIAQAELGREQTEERKLLMEELADVEARWEAQNSELQQFKECDPALMALKKKQAAVAKEAANRWTDNIFIMQSWARDKFNMETENFNKYFDVPNDLDSV
ncbi:Meiotic nuclear division protein 1 [Coemansia sp. RSA 1804]|nr:Meiotic nuclear division protein 1 [Coemansia sp. RSA 1804]